MNRTTCNYEPQWDGCKHRPKCDFEARKIGVNLTRTTSGGSARVSSEGELNGFTLSVSGSKRSFSLRTCDSPIVTSL